MMLDWDLIKISSILKAASSFETVVSIKLHDVTSQTIATVIT